MLTEKRVGRSVKKEQSHTVAIIAGERGKIIDANPGNAYGNAFYIDRKTHRATIADSYHSCPRCEFLSKRSAPSTKTRISQIEIGFFDYSNF